MGWEQEEGGVLPNLKEYGNFVVLANKEHGILIAPNVAQFVAMEGNALYDQTAAAREAHTLVTEPGRCPADLIRYLFEHHLLPDAVLPADAPAKSSTPTGISSPASTSNPIIPNKRPNVVAKGEKWYICGDKIYR